MAKINKTNVPQGYVGSNAKNAPPAKERKVLSQTCKHCTGEKTGKKIRVPG